jgi:senataxin
MQILDEVEFNTTDAFQGRESEVIIFSCVRASPAGGIGFLQDIRRMNVGLTRAKSSLWVLGNSQSLVRGEFWRKLVEDAKGRDRYTEGNIMNMLSKHSSKFPAKGAASTSYDMPTHIKQEPRDPRLKQEQRIKQEPQNTNSSSGWLTEQKDTDFKDGLMDFDYSTPAPATLNPGVKRKMEEFTEDVDMVSPPPDADSPITPSTSEAGTPAAVPDNSTSGTTTPAPDGNKIAAGTSTVPSGPVVPPPGDVIGGMTAHKPKIRRKRPDANPLLVRAPKKPRPS